MPTARSRASSTCYKHWLVVAGGYSDEGRESTVEILDVNNNRWSTAPPIPTSWAMMRSTMLEGTWYLLGGDTKNGYGIYSISLEELVKSPPSFNMWTEHFPLEMKNSCPLSFGRSLLAVGGSSRGRSKSFILHYIPEINTWVLAGDLPVPLHRCTSVIMADIMYVLGGESEFMQPQEMFYTVPHQKVMTKCGGRKSTKPAT